MPQTPDRSNNFDAMRLIAAFMVLVCHAAPLSGVAQPPPGVQDWWRTLGALGVFIFFSMSGYLICKSWDGDPNPLRYLSKRVLRILPGLTAVVFICALIVGPLFTTLPLRDYFSHADTYRYLQTALIYPVHFWLPGVFTDNPYPGINGSLWTLSLEFTLYLLVMSVGICCRRDRWKIVAFSVMLILFCLHAWIGESFSFAYMNSKALAINGMYFIAGALLYLLREKVSYRLIPCVVLIALVLVLPAELKKFALVLAVPYTTLAVATASTRFLKSAGKHGDFSYGFYIYAFPMEELFAHLFPGTHVTLYIAATTLLTALCAAASWHFIEKPMLNLKPARRERPNAAKVPGETTLIARQ